MRGDLVPLREVIPQHLTDYKCRSLLRSSNRFAPIQGRWQFKPKEAQMVKRFLASAKY